MTNDVVIVFVKPHGLYYPGTVAGFHPARAEFLISQGVARPHFVEDFVERKAVFKDSTPVASGTKSRKRRRISK